MPTAEKVEQVSALSQKMSAAKSIFMADFTGLDVASVTELRRALRGASVDYQVVKNRLAKRAAADAGLDGLSEYLSGPTAMTFAQEDPLEPARILQKFIDKGGKLAIKSGVLDGDLLSPEQVKQLALLPTHDELIVKLMGLVRGPLYGLAGVLSGLLRGLVGTLAALEESRRDDDGGGGD